MGRKTRGSGEHFRPAPPKQIELSDKNLGKRFVATAVLLLLGAGLLAYSLMKWLTPASGWQTIKAEGTGEASCAQELTFLYEASSTAEVRAVTTLYTDACKNATRLLSPYEDFEGVVNVHSLNQRPNEVLTVDEALYKALETVLADGHRELYLGPIYARYGDLFGCTEDSQLQNYDPRLSPVVAEEYAQVLRYANDPQSIDLELLGENRVCLKVSGDYLAFAQRQGLERFLDFDWLYNAFAIDMVAEALEARGYQKGVLSSCDGYARNLDPREGTYDYPLYTRQGESISYVTNLRYQGPKSLVCLRDFATNEEDRDRFYTLQNGEVRTVYLDVADGFCRSAVSSLLTYGEGESCGALLMKVLPLYVAEELDQEGLAALASQGIHSLYCQGKSLYYSDPQVQLSQLDSYKAEPMKP